MHICTVVPNYLPEFGGAEVGTHLVLRQLAETTKHHFSVVTATTDSNLPRYELMDGVAVYRYVRPPIWANWYGPVLYAFLNVGRLIKKVNPDIVNMTYVLPSGIAAWYAGKRRHIPTMMMLGGADLYDPFNMPDRLLCAWSGYCIRHTNMLVAWSRWAETLLWTRYRASEHRTRVIPFGVDTTRFSPNVDGTAIRQRHNIPDDSVLLFALQRLEMRKGTDVLLKAMKHILDTCPQVSWRLIIGGKGRDWNELNSLCTDLGLNERVIFSGFIPEDEKPLYYAAADVFVLHTYHEGLGIVIAEASATGLPVVTTRAGGTLDVVRDMETGLLVPPGNAVALGDAICQLIQDNARRKTMGRASFQFAVSHFSLEVVAQQFLRVFEAQVDL